VARLDRPALDRLRDCTQRGEVDAVVVLSPDRLARNYAHQWLLVEEFAKWQTPWLFLPNPFGDTPQGKLLIQLQGMMAEYERAQILERTRRGRLEKARRGEYLPWAYRCYGYRYLPKRHGCPPQVMSEPPQAAVIQQRYRALIEEQMSSRQITKRLNAAQIPPPGGKSPVWQPAGEAHLGQPGLRGARPLQLPTTCAFPGSSTRDAGPASGETPTELSARRGMDLERSTRDHFPRVVRESAGPAPPEFPDLVPALSIHLAALSLTDAGAVWGMGPYTRLPVPAEWRRTVWVSVLRLLRA
jgi:DNA invertase Pin-like site-specific DNA recombinase